MARLTGAKNAVVRVGAHEIWCRLTEICCHLSTAKPPAWSPSTRAARPRAYCGSERAPAARSAHTRPQQQSARPIRSPDVAHAYNIQYRSMAVTSVCEHKGLFADNIFRFAPKETAPATLSGDQLHPKVDHALQGPSCAAHKRKYPEIQTKFTDNERTRTTQHTERQTVPHSRYQPPPHAVPAHRRHGIRFQPIDLCRGRTRFSSADTPAVSSLST